MISARNSIPYMSAVRSPPLLSSSSNGNRERYRFDSTIEAVNSALKIQKVLELESETKLRIGIMVSDDVMDGDEVYCDGVHILIK